QTALCKPTPDALQYCSRLRFAPAMDDYIVSKTLEVDARKRPRHPHVERIMQEQIGQERTDDTALRGAFRPFHQESGWKQGSTSGSSTIFTTVCATRSAMVGMPSGRVPPLSFGISTSRTGGGRYEPDDIRFQTLYRLPLRSCSNAASDTPSTPAAPRFARTRW